MGNINRISPIHPIPSATITMSVPAFSDIAKSSNDLLSKDFYHLNATTFELKSSTPSNVGFKVTGKSTHEGSNSGLLEAKYADKPSGLTLTQTWNTVNALDTKIELNDAIAKGLKAEVLGSFLPASQNKGAKFNLHFKQANFHGRAFFDLLKGPTANVDAVIGQDGFLAGFSAAYYHKVNSQVEAGAKATWDSKSGNQVGLEVASKSDWTPSHSPRSRSTTVVSPLSPTTFSSALVSPLASEPPLIPKSSTKLPTRSVPPSSSTHRLRMREDLGIGPYSTIDGDKTVPAEFA